MLNLCHNNYSHATSTALYDGPIFLLLNAFSQPETLSINGPLKSLNLLKNILTFLMCNLSLLSIRLEKIFKCGVLCFHKAALILIDTLAIKKQCVKQNNASSTLFTVRGLESLDTKVS